MDVMLMRDNKVMDGDTTIIINTAFESGDVRVCLSLWPLSGRHADWHATSEIWSPVKASASLVGNMQPPWYLWAMFYSSRCRWKRMLSPAAAINQLNQLVDWQIINLHIFLRNPLTTPVIFKAKKKKKKSFSITILLLCFFLLQFGKLNVFMDQVIVSTVF